MSTQNSWIVGESELDVSLVPMALDRRLALSVPPSTSASIVSVGTPPSQAAIVDSVECDRLRAENTALKRKYEISERDRDAAVAQVDRLRSGGELRTYRRRVVDHRIGGDLLRFRFVMKSTPPGEPAVAQLEARIRYNGTMHDLSAIRITQLEQATQQAPGGLFVTRP